MINGREHDDIMSGAVWPEVMVAEGGTNEVGYYMERYRDGRVLLKVNCVFTADQWQTFLESLQLE